MSTSGRAPKTTRTLAELPVGATATVERVLGERRLAIRLMELGLVPGTSVHVERKAPLGDPVELSIRGYGLSIRRADADRIMIGDAREGESP